MLLPGNICGSFCNNLESELQIAKLYHSNMELDKNIYTKATTYHMFPGNNPLHNVNTSTIIN